MNEDERDSVTEGEGIQERFWVFIEDDSGVMIRQKPLENERTPVPDKPSLWVPEWPKEQSGTAK